MSVAHLPRISLHYDWRPGDGVPLVLLHEMGGTLKSWDLVRALLPGRASLALDLRGFGLSEKPPGPVTIQAHVGDVVALLDQLGIRRAHLAGCAVGGGVAMATAAALGERATALTALAPATGVPAERREAVLGLARMLEQSGLRGFLEEDTIPKAWPSGTFDRSGPGYATFLATQLSTPPGSLAATYRMLADLDLSGTLAELNCPTTIVAGTHDMARPPELLRAFAGTIPGAAFREIDSGHFMALQTPALVADLLR